MYKGKNWLEKNDMARENNNSRATWQLWAEAGRTRKDVLPYKSASVWCTAINMNDLPPPRACFGIQGPHCSLPCCSSFGPPSPRSLEELFSLELTDEAKIDCSAVITCPCPQGLTCLPVLQSQHITTLELRQNSPSRSHATNRCPPQLLRSHTC